MTVYLLDANVFIAAKNLHYGFDFCPAFWDWIRRSHRDGKVFSIEKVRDELIGFGDDLADWARDQPDEFFVKPDQQVVTSLQEVSVWASAQTYEQAAVTTFLQLADYYLVAQAHAQGCVVVTHEVVGHSTKKIKIPDACVGMKVRCVTPYAMLRTERARFVLR